MQSVLFPCLGFLLAANTTALKTPETSRHFEQWTDPASGVVSYVLKTHVADQQQTFYFTNRSMTKDERFLWFYCGTSPGGTRTLGLVDFATDEVYSFPETSNVYASPYVDTGTGDVYWADIHGVYCRPASRDGRTKPLCGVPDSFPEVTHRLYRLVCHLTPNASKTKFFLDARVDNTFVCGDLEIATGAYTEWGRTLAGANHAQFSPADDKLVLICKDYWNDAVTGELHGIPSNTEGVFERLWLWREGQAEPVLIPPIDGGRATHEWWSANGKYIYYCTYPNYGIARYDVATGKQHMITTIRATHAHSSSGDNYFTFDQHVGEGYRGCPWKVFFYNPESGRAVAIVTHSPAYNTPENPSPWHPDPHPNFVGNDKYIVSTTNIDGMMNVLVTPVAPLIAISQGSGDSEQESAGTESLHHSE